MIEVEGCWVVVELLWEVIGWQDRHDVTSYTKVRQAPSWPVGHVITASCHHCVISHHHHAIWWWIMRSNRYWISPSLSLGICQVSITLFSSCDHFLLCFIISSLTLCDMPLSLLILRQIPFPWQRFPFVSADSFVLITHFIFLRSYQLFSPSFLPLFLLLFYLWVTCLWSSVTPTVLVLKLYWVVWLELPSFVTSGYPRPSALIVLKVKTRQYSEYPLRRIHSPSTLGHCGDSKAYLE